VLLDEVDDLIGVEGLAEERARAGGKRLAAALVIRGDDDDPEVGAPLAQSPHELDAVHVGKPEVDEGEARLPAGVDQLESGPRVLREHGAVSGDRLDHKLEHARNIRVVLDTEDVTRRDDGRHAGQANRAITGVSRSELRDLTHRRRV
jgi:hypothetical protein